MRLLFIIIYFLGGILFAQPLPVSAPEKQGMDSGRLSRVDTLINQAVENGDIPGAVLLITRNDKIVTRKAYGYEELIPEKKVMPIDAVFDLASVTKPMATATSAMILLERGKLRLLDRVSDFIPGYKDWYNEDSTTHKPVRIIHLLTHTSGLPPYAPVDILKEKYGAPAPDSLIHYIGQIDRAYAPGEHFKYSCLNFITLQRIIETVSGQSLMDFSAQNIFRPLNMKATTYKPTGDLLNACVPTELLNGTDLLKGTVHDPLARVMNGCISGNAGLFSNADDMAIFASMMLNHGIFNGVRILSPAGVEKMTEIPAGYEKFGRALGWDMYSDYSSNIGDLFSARAYGHTGYTGTSIVIDPHYHLALILLTNRVHPYDKGSVVRLRNLVANIVAASIFK